MNIQEYINTHYYTVKQAADIVFVKVRTLKRLSNVGKVDGFEKLNNDYYYNKVAFDKFAAKFGTRLENDKRLLDFIVKYKCEHGGICPTYQEMSKGAEINSMSLLNVTLNQLEKQNRIIRRSDSGSARTIQIPGESYVPPEWYQE